VALSYSQLQCFRRCPKQYEFAFIKKVSRPLTTGESFGSSIHLALKKWGELEQSLAPRAHAGQIALFTDDHHGPAPKPDLHTLKMFWRQSFIAQGYGSRAEQDAALMRGERALEHFFRWWQQVPRTIAACEKGFTLDIPSRGGSGTISIAGRFDRVEHGSEGLRIIDFKSGMPRNQQEADADLQLSIYAAAAARMWNAPVADLRLLFLGEEELVEVITTRNASQISDAQKTIAMLAEDMERAPYRGTPTTEKCRSCPYREICPVKIA
jgi:hypothetical protein